MPRLRTHSILLRSEGDRGRTWSSIDAGSGRVSGTWASRHSFIIKIRNAGGVSMSPSSVTGKKHRKRHTS